MQTDLLINGTYLKYNATHDARCFLKYFWSTGILVDAECDGDLDDLLEEREHEAQGDQSRGDTLAMTCHLAFAAEVERLRNECTWNCRCADHKDRQGYDEEDRG